MSVSTEDKDDSASAPVPNELPPQGDANPRSVKSFKHTERGPRSSQSSDYSDRRKFGGDRNQSRGWRGGDRRGYRGRGGFGRRRGGGSFNNRFNNNNNSWRGNRPEYVEPEYSDTNVYVANLPEQWDDNKLAAVFVEFGEIESAAIMHANRDDRQRIAFVNFRDAASAAKTIETLNGNKFENHDDPDRGLIVKKAYRKNQHRPPPRNGDHHRNSGRRYDRNSSHNSMSGSGMYQGSQSNGSGSMNHNKNMHSSIKSSNGRRPPSGPPMGHQNQINPPANQPSFQPQNMDSRSNQMTHGSTDTDQLTQQMGSNWGPTSGANERHQRNAPSNRNKYQGTQQQPPRNSNQHQQPPQQQQQFMMHVVPQMHQMPQNYQYMHDMQGNPMQMQMMDASGNMVPVMFPQQTMQQPQMQLVNMPGPNGEWVQQMMPIQQPHQIQHMQMQHVEHQQGNPMSSQLMHGEMHQHNMMYDMQHDAMNPYAMQQHMQQMQHNSYNADIQRTNSSSQPPPGFQTGHMQDQMRQMPQGHSYMTESNGHQFASPRMNFGYPSSTSSQVYPSAMGLPVHPESSQTENSSNHMD